MSDGRSKRHDTTPEIEAVLIGAGTTAFTSAIAWTVNQVFKRGDLRAAAADAARDRAVQALEAIMRDAQEVRFNLAVLQNQWSGWRARARRKPFKFFRMRLLGTPMASRSRA